jgi:hypothetical protein
VARSLDLHGVAGAGPLVHRPPATQANRLLGVIGGGVSHHPGLDRFLAGQGEVGVLGQHLQHRPVQPNPPHLGPQGPVQVGRAHKAQAKVVLVGDDRQLAPIDAGGGFRALRLRLSASELVENRRQQQAWEREALDLVRSGLVEEAVAAYQAHDRVVAADSKPAATLALLQDWWAAWQLADHDPDQEVIVLAARRAEVDRLNTACQELLTARGRLGAERLQVEDRQLAVGDRVVCGHNAIAELGVANGSRGTITTLDPHARTLTLCLDGTDGREVILPRSYLDGRGRGERNRRVDLAYATTGHRAKDSPGDGPWSGSPAPKTSTGCTCSCPEPARTPAYMR